MLHHIDDHPEQVLYLVFSNYLSRDGHRSGFIAKEFIFNIFSVRVKIICGGLKNVGALFAILNNFCMVYVY